MELGFVVRPRALLKGSLRHGGQGARVKVPDLLTPQLQARWRQMLQVQEIWHLDPGTLTLHVVAISERLSSVPVRGAAHATIYGMTIHET